MDTPNPEINRGKFKSAASAFAGFEAVRAADLVAAVTDVALVLDRDGMICDASFGSKELAEAGFEHWMGKSWYDVVTSESKPKLDDMLQETSKEFPLRWRQVTHPTKDGIEIPVQYTTVPLNDQGGVLAVGRNLAQVEALQQRMIEAQLKMEREYARFRKSESRYRLMFQVAKEPVVVVELDSGKIQDINPAAASLLGQDVRRLMNSGLAGLFQSEERSNVQNLLNSLARTGESQDVIVSSSAAPDGIRLSGCVVRQEGTSLGLVRLGPVDESEASTDSSGSMVQRLVEASPEGFVVTDMDGVILQTNDAFLDMSQVSSKEQAVDRSIDRWLGRTSVDFNVLMANLKEHGTVRSFQTEIRNEFGGTQEVEVSAVAVTSANPACIGLNIRSLEGSIGATARTTPILARSVEQVSQLVGRVPLKDLVQETTDIIEKLCIEAALDLTGDNRASAAELLGLSRQSLYVKLRQFGMAARTK